MAGFFRGASADQVKHNNADQKLINKLTKEGRFPAHFSKKVDMAKVSMDVMRPWITQKITDLLGFEDDIVVGLCLAQLEEKKEAGDKGVDPKSLQVNLTGFMERKAAPFCSELWKYLLQAQESPVGVPQEFIDKKKSELQQKREEANKVQEELKRRKADLEAAQRGGARDRGGDRGGADHRGDDRRGDDDRRGGADRGSGRGDPPAKENSRSIARRSAETRREPRRAASPMSGGSPSPQPRKRRRFD